jgi:hypothetical protein
LKARSWSGPSSTVAPASSSHLRAAAAIHAGGPSVGAPMHARDGDRWALSSALTLTLMEVEWK